MHGRRLDEPGLGVFWRDRQHVVGGLFGRRKTAVLERYPGQTELAIVMPRIDFQRLVGRDVGAVQIVPVESCDAQLHPKVGLLCGGERGRYDVLDVLLVLAQCVACPGQWQRSQVGVSAELLCLQQRFLCLEGWSISRYTRPSRIFADSCVGSRCSEFFSCRRALRGSPLLKRCTASS